MTFFLDMAGYGSLVEFQFGVLEQPPSRSEIIADRGQSGLPFCMVIFWPAFIIYQYLLHMCGIFCIILESYLLENYTSIKVISSFVCWIVNKQ